MYFLNKKKLLRLYAKKENIIQTDIADQTQFMYE